MVEVLDVTPDVLACAWVDGRELHVVDRGDGRGLFIAVEESVRAGTGRPLMLTGKGVPSSDTIWSSWLQALVRQSTLEEDGRVARPRVDACDGDLVLLNQQPVLVSLSPGPIVRDRKAWERDLLDLRCGARVGALRWGDRAGARTALTRALVSTAIPSMQPVQPFEEFTGGPGTKSSSCRELHYKWHMTARVGTRCRIGEVAARLGVTTRTIRYYEELGLLGSGRKRSKGAHRLYCEADIAHLQGVLRLRDLLGLSLE